MVGGSKDRPFLEVLELGNKMIENGITVFQKFTCIHCNSRQTMTIPNVLYQLGKCEECSRVTDIEAHGCGLMAVMSFSAGQD